MAFTYTTIKKRSDFKYNKWYDLIVVKHVMKHSQVSFFLVRFWKSLFDMLVARRWEDFPAQTPAENDDQTNALKE